MEVKKVWSVLRFFIESPAVVPSFDGIPDIGPGHGSMTVVAVDHDRAGVSPRSEKTHMELIKMLLPSGHAVAAAERAWFYIGPPGGDIFLNKFLVRHVLTSVLIDSEIAFWIPSSIRLWTSS